MIITPELPAHAAAIESLLDGSFGPKRHSKTVYKLRRGVPHLAELSFVAMADDGEGGQRLVGTIRYWPVLVGGVPALMLGPIAIDPACRSAGLGGKLIRHSLARARELGHRIVILVGDAPYYVRFGFSRAVAAGLSLPGPVDPDRFLGLELVEGAMAGVAGMVTRAMPARSAALRGIAERAGTAAESAGGLPSRTGTSGTRRAVRAAAAVIPADFATRPAAPLPAALPAPDLQQEPGRRRPRRSARQG